MSDQDLAARLNDMADELWQADGYEDAAILFAALGIIIREYHVSWQRREPWREPVAVPPAGLQKAVSE